MGNIARTCCYVHAKNVVVYLEWKTLHAVIFKRFRLKVTRKWEALFSFKCLGLLPRYEKSTRILWFLDTGALKLLINKNSGEHWRFPAKARDFAWHPWGKKCVSKGTAMLLDLIHSFRREDRELYVEVICIASEFSGIYSKTLNCKRQE
jgi:hypothetical protein